MRHVMQDVLDALTNSEKVIHWSQFSFEKYFVGAVPYQSSPAHIPNMVFDSHYEEPQF